MSIDLGNEPVGTPPTDIQKTQLRASLGLGASDTVEFGAMITTLDTLQGDITGYTVTEGDLSSYTNYS